MKEILATGLPSKPHTVFRSSQMEQRSEVSLRLAEHIWNPNRVMEAAA